MILRNQRNAIVLFLGEIRRQSYGRRLSTTRGYVLLALSPRSRHRCTSIQTPGRLITTWPLVYVQTNGFDLAASEFRSVIRQKPDSYIAHNGLGLALERLGRLEEAVEEFKTVTELKPDFFYGSVNLAEISLKLKRYAAAEYHIQKALALSPPSAVAQRMRLDLGMRGRRCAIEGNPGA